MGSWLGGILWSFFLGLFGLKQKENTEDKLEEAQIKNKEKDVEIAVMKGKEERRDEFVSAYNRGKNKLLLVPVMAFVMAGCSAAKIVECPVNPKYTKPIPKCQRVSDSKPEEGKVCIIDCTKYPEESTEWAWCQYLNALAYQEECKTLKDVLRGS